MSRGEARKEGGREGGREGRAVSGCKPQSPIGQWPGDGEGRREGGKEEAPTGELNAIVIGPASQDLRDAFTQPRTAQTSLPFGVARGQTDKGLCVKGGKGRGRVGGGEEMDIFINL